MLKITVTKSDTLGAAASILCLIHCLATPFLFVAQAYTMEAHGTSPVWWKNLDFVFLFISFLAVNRSAKNTSKKFMKPALWTSWGVLLLLLINERFNWYSLPEILTYTVAIGLAVLHIYNLRYCQCKNDKCCIKNG